MTSIKQNRFALLLVLLLSTAQPLQVHAADSDTNEDVASLLRSEYAKSVPISDTLLQPLPTHSDNGIDISFPPAKYLLPIGEQKLPPIKLEASFNRGITLQEALTICLYNNLPIKISKDLLNSQRALFTGALGRFLPDLSMTYRKQDIDGNGQRIASLTTSSTALTWTFFQGGAVLFGAIGKYYDMKAAKGAYSATVNNSLLDVYKKYNDVLYNQALLRVRIKAVETSRSNLHLTKEQLKAGTGTKYAVMQSETQLASDAQNLISQQVATRKSAIALAVTLNVPVLSNLLPEEDVLSKTYIVDPTLDAAKLSSLAMKNRPEIKEYESQYRSVKASVAAVAGPLMPSAQIFVSANNNQIDGGASITALSAPGGIPSAGTSGIGIGGVAGKSLTLGSSVTWTLSGMGVRDSSNIVSNRFLARRAMNQYNQELLSISQEVRDSFLDMETAEQQIDITNVNVKASREGLRLAELRLKAGTGTNLELIQSQKSYVEALASQIKAFIDFRNAQAQVLRDTGAITPAALLNERNSAVCFRQSVTR